MLHPQAVGYGDKPFERVQGSDRHVFLNRHRGQSSSGTGEILVHPTATIDIKGPTIAFHLSKLGLKPGASWDEIDAAYDRLIADVTPGASASHANVALANSLRVEVETAYHALGRFRTAGRPNQVG